MNNWSRIFLTISVMLLASCSSGDQEQEQIVDEGPDYNVTYDLYIKGGTIVDGTGDPSFVGDLLVSGDMIAYVGETDETKVQTLQTIDATDRIVSPGFIDAHAHVDKEFQSSEEIHTCRMVRGMANPSIVIYKMGCECHEQAVGSGSLAENIQQRFGFVIGRHDDADAVVATVKEQ